MKRREFLKKAAIPPAAIAADQVLGADQKAVAASETAPRTDVMPRREYGKTGIKLSIIGFGSYMLNKLPQERADRLVAMAVERGVNYFDVAPTYGNAEQRLGPALQRYRKDCFLACKTTQRNAKEAEKELQASLKRLGTDHFDLYQLHAINQIKKDVDAVFAKGGAMETFIRAKKSGLVRHLGFSAHSAEAAMAALDRYDFDSILFPVNFACYHKGNFGPQVVAKARAKGAAVLAIKAMAKQKWTEDNPNPRKWPNCWYQPMSDAKDAELALKFAMSQSVTSAVSPADAGLFELALRLAPKVLSITPNEQQELKTLAAGLTPVFSSA